MYTSGSAYYILGMLSCKDYYYIQGIWFQP